MLNDIKLEDILFIDIETVPLYPSFDELPQRVKDLWEDKSSYFRNGNKSAAEVYDRAALYAEFGKIICISAGVFTSADGPGRFKIKSFFGDEEKSLLVEFSGMVKKFSSRSSPYLCAHNGKEFDFPFLARRILINGLKIPDIIDVSGKKPWEAKFLDTMDLWKFGSFRHYVSLRLLAYIFGIPDPKDNMEGSKVAHTYYVEKDMTRIVRYCENDVLSIAQLILKYKGDSILGEGDVEVLTKY